MSKNLVKDPKKDIYVKITYSNKNGWIFDIIKIPYIKDSYVFKEKTYEKEQLFDLKYRHIFNIYESYCSDTDCQGCYNEYIAKNIEELSEEVLLSIEDPNPVVQEFIRIHNTNIIEKQKKQKYKNAEKNYLKNELKTYYT